MGESRPRRAFLGITPLFWLLIFAYFNLHVVFLFGYKYLDFVTWDRPVLPARPFVEELTGTYGAFLLLPLVIWAVRRVPFRRDRWLRPLAWHCLALPAYSFAHTSWNALSRHILFPLLGMGHYDYGRMPVRYAMEFSGDAVGWISLSGFVILFDYYRRARAEELRAVQLQNSLTQSQLQTLRLQMEPHFLFNSLNAISAAIYEDVAAADEMISALADLLRRSLDCTQAQEIALSEELALLRDYLLVMQSRLEDKLKVTIDTDEFCADAAVPPLILQPLVENAIRHGLNPANPSLTIKVKAAIDDNNLCLSVGDNGRGAADRTQPLRLGIGLGNIRRRLETLYGGAHRFDIEHPATGGFLVTIGLPFRHHDADPLPAGR